MREQTVVVIHYWHAITEDRVQCDFCLRLSKIKVGQQGLCFVRANIEIRLS